MVLRLGCWLCTCTHEPSPLPTVNPGGGGKWEGGLHVGFGETKVWTDVAARLGRAGEVDRRVPTAAPLLVFLVLAAVGQAEFSHKVGRGCGWVRAPLGRLGGSLVMQAVGEREGLGDDEGALFGIGGRRGRGSSPLTAVMHGVAGYDHRRGHGDGGAAHGELVGDGVIRTAAAEARLARRGSWRNSNNWVISRLRKRGPSGRQARRRSSAGHCFVGSDRWETYPGLFLCS